MPTNDEIPPRPFKMSQHQKTDRNGKRWIWYDFDPTQCMRPADIARILNIPQRELTEALKAGKLTRPFYLWHPKEHGATR